MTIIDEVFAGVSDTQDMQKLAVSKPGLKPLLDEYDSLAARVAQIEPITAGMTGLQWKAGLKTLSLTDQVRLSYRYFQLMGLLDAETEEQKDERKLRFFIVRTGVIVATAFVMMMSGAVLAYMFHHPAQDHDPVISNMLSTAAEIAKILLNIGNFGGE